MHFEKDARDGKAGRAHVKLDGSRIIEIPAKEAELETGLGLAGTSAQTEHLLFFLLDFLELWGSFREVQIHKSSNSLAGVKLLELSFKPEFIGLNY